MIRFFYYLPKGARYSLLALLVLLAGYLGFTSSRPHKTLIPTWSLPTSPLSFRRVSP